MRNPIIILVCTLIVFNFTSCKKEPSIAYKYADKPQVITCENAGDLKLLNEAYYSFEEDLTNGFLENDPNKNLTRAHMMFVQRSSNGQTDAIQKMLSEHSVAIFNELIKTGLFDASNPKIKLIQNSELVNCLLNGITDEQAKKTLKALQSTNYSTPHLIGETARNIGSRAFNDKQMNAYLAFSIYYNSFFDIDLTQVKDQKTEGTPTPENNQAKQ